MIPRIGHVMILASAGSGKTYQLTNRFVRLLALGARPERIVALTFTRKAAGEFFDEILNKLARAAGNPATAERLAREIGAPGLRADDFLRLLRGVTDAMHLLRLGTLDGFFARIARNFPLELGLTGEFEILQEHAARQERTRVLQRMFERTGELDETQKKFIEAFKRATFGADEKRLGAQLDQFIDRHQDVFLAAPEPDRWGDSRRIWPKGSPWSVPADGIAAAVEALRGALARRDLSDGQRQRWENFFAALPEWVPGAPLPAPVEYVLKNALLVWEELNAGRAAMTVERKKLELASEESAALVRIVKHLVGTEMVRRLEMTRGIHAVLKGYETVYHDAVRRAGKLTFADVQRLLLPEKEGGRVLARDTEENRQFIDFRMDAKIDHWLLDEFQDTSHGQWSVLRNLIDEAVQDPTGLRSFFYVGDVKQSIFAWREGDPRLFREIFQHYNQAQAGVIAEEHLVESRRSGPPIIAMVNRVFGAKAALADLFPGEASDAWSREWLDHRSALPQLGGHAALLHAEDEGQRFALALRLLDEIRPLERGLTCALLVQKNETATQLADYLRSEGGLPAVAESDLHVCIDNPLGAALLALVKAAAYPDDSLAHGHLAMTPLAPLLRKEGLGDPEALTRRVLGQIHGEGFEPTLNGWLQRLEPQLAADDRFNRERARQLTAAAALFDATGSRDVGEFIQFTERHTVREADTAAVIQVMTIHKSKGLGFDLVLLPDLEGTKLDALREGKLAVRRAADRSIEWVLDLPGKLFAERDPTLAAHIRAAEATECYEKLSLLYVAMTRAKRAMYLITKPPGKSTSRNFPRLLAETLGESNEPIRVGKMSASGSFAAGDPDWHGSISAPHPAPATAEAKPERLEVAASRRARRLPPRRPSAEKIGSVDAVGLFSLEGRAGADFGAAVHALFAEVEWAEGPGREELAATWQTREGGSAPVAEATACLLASSLAEIWAKPKGARRTEVWRERPFEMVLEGAWVTGVFDRVIVESDAAGHPVRAMVIDFKTDRFTDAKVDEAAITRYAPQLNLYRHAVAVLTGLPISAIACELVLTRRQLRIAVPSGEK
jgi:ATP-dependent exoDNAse (exonuclease V) beta subunit